MKPDKYRKRFSSRRNAGADDRRRRQIATEAAKRMLPRLGPDADGRLREADEAEYYAAKCKAAAVLGHAVRPGDLPSDSEIREQVLALARDQNPHDPYPDEPEPGDDDLPHISEHLDRFALYRLRLLPLEDVKQDPHHHPEGDALYHSLQVFELARERRPYDEEFLLAALLHDIGKAIEPRAHVAAALQSLKDAITPRTAWLIEHHHDLSPRNQRHPAHRDRKALESHDSFEDLQLLRELDLAGTAIGTPVCTIDEALTYIQSLEQELEHDPQHNDP